MARRTTQYCLIFLIILNALVLGIQTSPAAVAWCGHWLQDLDNLILGIFVLELILLIAARGARFFRDPWCVFDLFVILIATFVIVNLFVAVIVNSISDARADDAATGGANRDAVRRELDALREEYSLLKHEALARRR